MFIWGQGEIGLYTDRGNPNKHHLSFEESMENWDEDFSTLKLRPRNLSSKPLSAWKADIPLDDGDMTITKRRTPDAAFSNQQSAPRNISAIGFDSEGDEDLAEAFENAINSRRGAALKAGSNVIKPQTTPYNEALELSDSGSTQSPGRASSISSVQSFSSNTTSWDDKAELNDSDFEFDNNFELNLKARMKNRQERAKAAAVQEQAQLAELAKTVKKRQSFRPMVELDDDLLDLGIDKLPAKLKSGTVNKNIKFGHPAPNSSNNCNSTPQPSKMLRGMRSIAQMPNQRIESTNKLRGAVSMLDLGSRKQHDYDTKYDLATLKTRPYQPRSSGNTKVQPSSHHQVLHQRPLTSYKDPNLPPMPSHRKHRAKKPNLIQYPGQTLTNQKFNGMTLNTATGLWEGNEIDEAKFDLALDPPVKPKLITKHSYTVPENHTRETNGMLFDKRTLSWVYANEDEYDDPFGAIDDGENNDDDADAPVPLFQDVVIPHSVSQQRTAPSTPLSHNRFNKELRRVTNESTISSSSSRSNLRQSVLRGESSSHEVFDVSARQASEWRHVDERFMRKFGKWIGGDKEKADSLLSDQQFYEMVRNA